MITCIVLSFMAGVLAGVVIMSLANFMGDAEAESILDLTDGHENE